MWANYLKQDAKDRYGGWTMWANYMYLKQDVKEKNMGYRLKRQNINYKITNVRYFYEFHKVIGKSKKQICYSFLSRQIFFSELFTQGHTGYFQVIRKSI